MRLKARGRIALAFGAVFLLLGTVLLTVINVLARKGTRLRASDIARQAEGGPGLPKVEPDPNSSTPPGSLAHVTTEVSRAAAEQVLLWSVAGLAVTALLAVGVGWWTAGRVLRPVHAMTERARSMSARTLHERLAVDGPDDELKELGDTIDELLARLERAFDSQRRFVANASHELRTPLATQRTALQLGLDDPGDRAELARTKELLLATNHRSEQLIDGLLTLALADRGLDERTPVDLAEVLKEEAIAYEEEARAAGLTLTTATTSCPVHGNRVLLARLTANLLANAIAYNHPGGTVHAATTAGELTVTNTGPALGTLLDQAAADALFEPFRRGEGRDRTGTGSGLGLSIVRSIAEAHGGTATARPAADGGLRVTVRIPNGERATRL